MWAHYAANHTGFVIRFSEKHPYFDRRRSDTDEFLHLRRVRYVQDIRYRALIELTGQEIFVTKKADWSYEKEWRMLAPLEMADKVVTTTSEPVYLFAVPADCIEGVILGAKASNATRDTLSEVRFGDPRFRHLTLAMARIAFDQQAVKIDPLEGTA